MNEYTCTVVSHTHWDREWYLPFQVFRLRLVELVDTVLEMLGRDPDFRAFTLDGQTILLEDDLVVRPERGDELRRFIQAGRLLIGPWYVLPDEFLVSGEALIRNLILGGRVCGQFGSIMDQPAPARISFGVPVTAAQRVNLLEEIQADLTVHGQGSLDLKAHAMENVSIRAESDRSD